MTVGIDILVLDLAQGIQSYPETEREVILELARRLDEKTAWGEKQLCKDSLIDLLGYDTKENQVTGSLQTIPKNVMYLIDIGVQNISKVVTRHPPVLALDVERSMKPRIEYLLSIGVKETDIGKVVTRLPQILSYDIERSMKLRVEYLKSIGVKETDIGKVVTKLPHVLEYSVEDTMKLRVEYLLSIGVKETDIGKVVTRLPQVLELHVEKNLKPTYEFLNDNFGVTAGDITNTPALLSYSLEKRIKLRYEFLKSKGLEKRYKAVSVLAPSDERFCKLLKVPLDEYQEFKEMYLGN